MVYPVLTGTHIGGLMATVSGVSRNLAKRRLHNEALDATSLMKLTKAELQEMAPDVSGTKADLVAAILEA
jgi:hypothetical protein